MQNDVDVMLDGCWRVVTWLNTDVDTLHVKKINLNDIQWVLSI
jgi:hypothetical protein